MSMRSLGMPGCLRHPPRWALFLLVVVSLACNAWAASSSIKRKRERRKYSTARFWSTLQFVLGLLFIPMMGFCIYNVVKDPLTPHLLNELFERFKDCCCASRKKRRRQHGKRRKQSSRRSSSRTAAIEEGDSDAEQATAGRKRRSRRRHSKVEEGNEGSEGTTRSRTRRRQRQAGGEESKGEEDEGVPSIADLYGGR